MPTPTDPSIPSPRVFISYSCSDLIPTLALDTYLRKYGVRTFLYFEDREGFEPGQILPEVILQELGWCDFYLLVWSDLTAVSDWVSSEIQMALDFDKPILPYRLDNTTLPSEIASLPSVVADDIGNQAALLLLIYGDSSIPPPNRAADIQLEPGLWDIEIADILQTATLKLNLHEDGSLNGEWEQGNITGQVMGGWTYENTDNRLTMKLEIRVGLRPNYEVLRVRLTKQQGGVIYGEDMYALGPVVRHYELYPPGVRSPIL